MLPAVPAAVHINGIPVVVKKKSPSEKKRYKLRMVSFNAMRKEKQFLKTEINLKPKLKECKKKFNLNQRLFQGCDQI